MRILNLPLNLGESGRKTKKLAFIFNHTVCKIGGKGGGHFNCTRENIVAMSHFKHETLQGEDHINTIGLKKAGRNILIPSCLHCSRHLWPLLAYGGDGCGGRFNHTRRLASSHV